MTFAIQGPATPGAIAVRLAEFAFGDASKVSLTPTVQRDQ